MVSNRIQRLRDKAVSPSICIEEFLIYFHEYFGDGDYDGRNYGKAFLYACSNITPVIDEDELVVGKTVAELSPRLTQMWHKGYKDKIFSLNEHMGFAQDSHMAIDYDLVLNSGIEGILATIDAYMESCSAEEEEFYTNCRYCLEGVLVLAQRYSRLATELASTCCDAQRKEELLYIAEVCANVPRRPAQNFYEAVQSVNFVTHCISFYPTRYRYQQFQLGHPDRYLLPFYEKDLKEGIISYESAGELIDCLAIQINNRVPSGLSSGYMVGGRDENGVVANDLTILCLEAISDLRLVYPSVGLCYNRDMPDNFLAKACEILAKGCSHPAIFNDEIIAEGLMEYGLTSEEAYNYIHSTCVEITPVGSSNVWVASPYTNLVEFLLAAMGEEYEDFESLLSRVLDSLSKSIEKNFLDQCAMRKHREQNGQNPLLSCFVNDCLRKGMDIEKGGGRYNWIMPSFVGMSNLVDSLYAIKTLVFDTGEMSMSQLKEATDADFEGYESLKARIENKIDKYGNDKDEVDSLYKRISCFIVSECRRHTPPGENGRLIPSVFCWIKHEQFGKETGATPDGRRAFFPLGDGSGPAQGREKAGPTASILSSTKWSHKEFIGGVAVNIKFSRTHMTGDHISKVMSLIKTYIDRGGFELQINVVDRQTLINARKNPDVYKDLVVRIGGYSDYYVRLTPGMQEELILRTEHEI